MFVIGETYKETFERYANELHEIAKPTTTNGVPDGEPYAAVNALAKLFEKFAEMEVPFCDLNRFCYSLIKDANRELVEPYYTPDEALDVVKDEIGNKGTRNCDLCHDSADAFYKHKAADTPMAILDWLFEPANKEEAR